MVPIAAVDRASKRVFCIYTSTNRKHVTKGLVMVTHPNKALQGFTRLYSIENFQDRIGFVCMAHEACRLYNG